MIKTSGFSNLSNVHFDKLCKTLNGSPNYVLTFKFGYVETAVNHWRMFTAFFGVSTCLVVWKTKSIAVYRVIIKGAIESYTFYC